MAKSSRDEIYRQVRRGERPPAIPFEGNPYTLTDFQREIEIFERLARAWRMKFVQSLPGTAASLWFGYGEDGALRGAVVADRFGIKSIDDAKGLTFFWTNVNSGMLSAARLGIGMAVVAEVGGRLYSCKFPKAEIAGMHLGIGKPDGSEVYVGRRLDIDSELNEQEAVLIKIPVSAFTEINDR